MEAVNGVAGEEKGAPPPPSPLTGCYLLIVIGEPHSNEHKDIILQRVTKGLLSWDVNDCLVDLEKELAVITEQHLEGEEARYGERLIQFASENLVTEILIHPVVSTLGQCIRNLLSSFTRHRHIIHSGYTFGNNGSWILQDGTFSLSDFSEAFQEIEVTRVLRAYENSISIDIHCSPMEWSKLPKEHFTKNCKIRVNPTDVLASGSPAIRNFINYLEPFLIPAELESVLESSDVVGNIRFSRPTLYVFPGGQGDAALFGINGFNMLVDGGFSRKACFWDFVRHLDRLDAVLLTRLNNSNISGIGAVLRRKKQNAMYPQIGHFFTNLNEKKALLSPDGDKDKDPLLINLLEEGQELVSNLKFLNLTPQFCYRDKEPINLYHKVGHGTLDMYVLNPAKDSKEVREFLHKWNNNDPKLFSTLKSNKDFIYPLQNLVSICALLVWQPADPEDTITRILFPGSAPQGRIIEGLDKIKSLDFVKHPVCTEKSLTPSLVAKKIDRIIAAKEKIPVDNKKAEMETNGIDKTVKKSDSTESEKSLPKLKKSMENGEKPKEKPTKPKPRTESQQRKPKPPTTPKKATEDTKPKPKVSPTATPAKSTKEANNRKVVESKSKAPPKKETSKPPAASERKPISRRPKEIVKITGSPSKKLNGAIQKRGKLDKEGTTDSSTVSTPSADQENSTLKKDISKMTTEEIKAQELADLKEEQEAVKEIEAVFRKGEGDDKDNEFRKIKPEVSLDEKESEEYLIIEKSEVIQEESPKEKLTKDSEESEKDKKAEEIIKDVKKESSSPEEKVDISSDKKEPALESQPDEKGSANIESGATTTAPTLPEDERMPLDEIKEDQVEEKHIKEDTKEKEIPQIPTKLENITKLPPAVGIRLDKQSHIRDVVKTPDEVADLPMHEAVDDLPYEKPEEKKSPEVIKEKTEEIAVMQKELSKSPDEEKETDEQDEKPDLKIKPNEQNAEEKSESPLQQLVEVKKNEEQEQIQEVKEGVSTIAKLDEKLQKLKDDIDEQNKGVNGIITHIVEELQHAEAVTIPSYPESPMIEDAKKVEVPERKSSLGRKSPKEREEDVFKIVASVAEVLKSDAPLEEFEGKIPYELPVTTELRETHITTTDSPLAEKPLITKEDTVAALKEELKSSPTHEETKETVQKAEETATSIEDAAKLNEDDAGIVHRMLVTASSEDGGEEIEICPPGTITFSKSSESSGRSTPEPPSVKNQSQKSSVVDVSDLTTVLSKNLPDDSESKTEISSAVIDHSDRFIETEKLEETALNEDTKSKDIPKDEKVDAAKKHEQHVISTPKAEAELNGEKEIKPVETKEKIGDHSSEKQEEKPSDKSDAPVEEAKDDLNNADFKSKEEPIEKVDVKLAGEKGDGKHPVEQFKEQTIENIVAKQIEDVPKENLKSDEKPVDLTAKAEPIQEVEKVTKESESDIPKEKDLNKIKDDEKVSPTLSKTEPSGEKDLKGATPEKIEEHVVEKFEESKKDSDQIKGVTEKDIEKAEQKVTKGTETIEGGVKPTAEKPEEKIAEKPEETIAEKIDSRQEDIPRVDGKDVVKTEVIEEEIANVAHMKDHVEKIDTPQSKEITKEKSHELKEEPHALKHELSPKAESVADKKDHVEEEVEKTVESGTKESSKEKSHELKEEPHVPTQELSPKAESVADKKDQVEGKLEKTDESETKGSIKEQSQELKDEPSAPPTELSPKKESVVDQRDHVEEKVEKAVESETKESIKEKSQELNDEPSAPPPELSPKKESVVDKKEHVEEKVEKTVESGTKEISKEKSHELKEEPHAQTQELSPKKGSIVDKKEHVEEIVEITDVSQTKVSSKEERPELKEESEAKTADLSPKKEIGEDKKDLIQTPEKIEEASQSKESPKEKSHDLKEETAATAELPHKQEIVMEKKDHVVEKLEKIDDAFQSKEIAKEKIEELKKESHTPTDNLSPKKEIVVEMKDHVEDKPEKRDVSQSPESLKEQRSELKDEPHAPTNDLSPKKESVVDKKDHVEERLEKIDVSESKETSKEKRPELKESDATDELSPKKEIVEYKKDLVQQPEKLDDVSQSKDSPKENGHVLKDEPHETTTEFSPKKEISPTDKSSAKEEILATKEEVKVTESESKIEKKEVKADQEVAIKELHDKDIKADENQSVTKDPLPKGIHDAAELETKPAKSKLDLSEIPIKEETEAEIETVDVATKLKEEQKPEVGEIKPEIEPTTKSDVAKTETDNKEEKADVSTAKEHEVQKRELKEVKEEIAIKTEISTSASVPQESIKDDNKEKKVPEDKVKEDTKEATVKESLEQKITAEVQKAIEVDILERKSSLSAKETSPEKIDTKDHGKEEEMVVVTTAKVIEAPSTVVEEIKKSSEVVNEDKDKETKAKPQADIDDKIESSASEKKEEIAEPQSVGHSDASKQKTGQAEHETQKELKSQALQETAKDSGENYTLYNGLETVEKMVLDVVMADRKEIDKPKPTAAEDIKQTTEETKAEIPSPIKRDSIKDAGVHEVPITIEDKSEASEVPKHDSPKEQTEEKKEEGFLEKVMDIVEETTEEISSLLRRDSHRDEERRGSKDSPDGIIEKVKDLVEETKEEITSIFRRDSHKGDEAVLEKSAHDIEESYDVVADMAKSVIFEKIDKKSEEEKAKEEQVLEKVAEAIEGDFQKVADMSQSVVFEKCDKPLSEGEKNERILGKVADKIEEDFKIVEDLTKSVVFEKCDSPKVEKTIEQKFTEIKGLFDQVEESVIKRQEMISEITATSSEKESIEVKKDTESKASSGRSSPEARDNLKVDNQDSLLSGKSSPILSEKSSPIASGKLTPETKEDSLLSGKSSPGLHDESSSRKSSIHVKSEDHPGLAGKVESCLSELVDKAEEEIKELKSEVKEAVSAVFGSKKEEVLEKTAKDIAEEYEEVTALAKSISFDKCEKPSQENIMTQSFIGSDIPQSNLDAPKKLDVSFVPEKKVSISDVQISIQEEPKKEFDKSTSDLSKSESAEDTKQIKEPDSVDSGIGTETDMKKKEEERKEIYPAGPSKPTETLVTSEPSLSGKSTPDIADVEKQKEKEETLKHEKHIPGSSTPPTVPVSPIIRKEAESAEEDDDELPGSPLSITSQVAHSRSSVDFEDKIDPMAQSFYGSLPLEEDSSTHLYEVTKAKYSTPQHEEEADLMSASFIGELPEKKNEVFESWGKPLGLPSPAPPQDNNKTGTPKKINYLLKNNKLNDDKKRSDSPVKYKKKIQPIYVDLTYVPHHGNSNYSYVDFFKKIRARYYVFSGIEPSREVYNALLEAKQTWEDKDLEVTIIPTYDTDILGYWVADNEELLTKYKIDLSPSASRCTINLQDHETSCSAYRLEF